MHVWPQVTVIVLIAIAVWTFILHPPEAFLEYDGKRSAEGVMISLIVAGIVAGILAAILGTGGFWDVLLK